MPLLAYTSLDLHTRPLCPPTLLLMERIKLLFATLDLSKVSSQTRRLNPLKSTITELPRIILKYVELLCQSIQGMNLDFQDFLTFEAGQLRVIGTVLADLAKGCSLLHHQLQVC